MTDDQIHRDVQLCAASHQALDAAIGGLTDADARRPSLLPGWTVGHVLTHIARNADGLGRMVEGAGRGESVDMYPGGREGREADIEAGAGRLAAELVADVRDAGARLDALFADAPAEAWSGTGSTIMGPVAIAEIPARRRGEVEIHRVDLGLGYGFADWPADYLRAELATMTARWASRKPMGFDDLPRPALALPPAERFAWLIGRRDVDGLAPAGIF